MIFMYLAYPTVSSLANRSINIFNRISGKSKSDDR